MVYFSDPQRCHEFMMKLRWPNGKVRCPRCSSLEVSYLPNAGVFKCYEKHPKQKFSLKVGTVFEDSPIGLDKWLPVMWLVVNSKNGVSSWEIHRAMGVTQKTAWFMLQRARLAMQDDRKGGKLSGKVEIDETFIGGKARNMHKSAKAKKLEGKGGGVAGKIGVQGLLERGGNNLLGRLTEPHVDDLHPGIAQRPRDHLGAPIMPVEAWLCDDDADFVHDNV